MTRAAAATRALVAVVTAFLLGLAIPAALAIQAGSSIDVIYPIAGADRAHHALGDPLHLHERSRARVPRDKVLAPRCS